MLHLISGVGHASAAQAAQNSDLVALGFPPITVSIFVAAFIASLIIDLIQHKNSDEISVGNAVAWSIFWILLSLGFYG